MITTINEWRKVYENNDWKEILDNMLGNGDSPEATSMWDNLTPEQQEEYIDHYYDMQTDFSQVGQWEDGIAPTYDEVKSDLMYLIDLGRQE